MNKIRIVFNSYNIDAMAATIMVIKAINYFSQKPDTPEYSIETVPHSPVNYVAPNMDYDFIFCIGTNMNFGELLEESQHTKNFFYVGYGTDIKGKELDAVLKGEGHVCTPYYMWQKELVGVDETYSPSLCKLTRQLLSRYFQSPDHNEQLNDDSISEVYNAIELYVWNDKMITAKDLALVHSNYDAIVNGALNGSGITYLTNPGTEKQNSPRTIKARSIISNGLAEHIYGTQKSAMRIQTLNCSEEYIHDLVRLISYPFGAAVFYQDIKHSRQWWIYGTDADKIADLIPHYRKHQDGNLIYLVSDMPRMTEK